MSEDDTINVLSLQFEYELVKHVGSYHLRISTKLGNSQKIEFLQTRPE